MTKIDQQHQKLVDIINSLYESFVDQTAAHKLGKIIEELIDYSNYHFKTEEELFHKFGYPESESHIAKHNDFIEKINEFAQKFKAGNVNLTYQLMNFLRNWLINHINGDDKDYSGFFRGKNI